MEQQELLTLLNGSAVYMYLENIYLWAHKIVQELVAVQQIRVAQSKYMILRFLQILHLLPVMLRVRPLWMLFLMENISMFRAEIFPALIPVLLPTTSPASILQQQTLEKQQLVG